MVLETIWYKSPLISLFMMSFSYIKLYLTAFHFTINIFYYIFQLTSCRSKPQEPSGEIWNGPPNTKGRKRPKKNAGLIRSVGGRVNKQGNLLSRLIQGDHKMSWSQHPPARISYRSLNSAQSYTIQMVPTATLLPQRCALGQGTLEQKDSKQSTHSKVNCVISFQWPPLTFNL